MKLNLNGIQPALRILKRPLLSAAVVVLFCLNSSTEAATAPTSGKEVKKAPGVVVKSNAPAVQRKVPVAAAQKKPVVSVPAQKLPTAPAQKLPTAPAQKLPTAPAQKLPTAPVAVRAPQPVAPVLARPVQSIPVQPAIDPRYTFSPDISAEELSRMRACQQPPPRQSNGNECQINMPADVIQTEYFEQLERWAIEAGNLFQVHPAMILAICNVESTLNPRATDGLNHGLCAMPVTNDWDLMVQFNAKVKKPASLKEAFSTEVNLPKSFYGGSNKRFLRYRFSLWSPKGQIFAMAERLKQISQETLIIYNRDQRGGYRQTGPGEYDGVEVQATLDNYFSGSKAKNPNDLREGLVKADPHWAHRTRWYGAFYNKHYMVQAALQAYYDEKKALPREFGLAWDELGETRPIHAWIATRYSRDRDPSDRHPVFEKIVYPRDQFEINRCYAWQAAGLCGDQPQGHLEMYSRRIKTRDLPGGRFHWSVRTPEDDAAEAQALAQAQAAAAQKSAAGNGSAAATPSSVGTKASATVTGTVVAPATPSSDLPLTPKAGAVERFFNKVLTLFSR